MIFVLGKQMWRLQLKLASEVYISRMSIYYVKNCHWWELTFQQMKNDSFFFFFFFFSFFTTI